MKRKETLVIYSGIALGALLLSFGLQLFLLPAKLATGGVGSLATILYYLFGVPLSLTNLLANAVLLLLGFRLLGGTSLLRTVAGVLFLSLFLEMTSHLPVIHTEPLIAAVCGGILVGAGVGVVIRCGGSTGGSDFAALMLNRSLPHISVPMMILLIDCVIILLAALTFGSLHVAFFSLLSLAVATRVTTYFCTLGDMAKSVFILSREGERIASCILSELSRGATGIHCRGMYSGREGVMLLTAVSPKQLPQLVRVVKGLDRNAFIIVTDARAVLGEGFKNATFL